MCMRGAKHWSWAAVEKRMKLWAGGRRRGLLLTGEVGAGGLPGGGDLAAGPRESFVAGGGGVREQAEEGLPSPGRTLVELMGSRQLWARCHWFLAGSWLVPGCSPPVKGLTAPLAEVKLPRAGTSRAPPP